jgi:hypothetical protein
MALIQDVKSICARLAPRGWREFLKRNCGGLDIGKPVGQLAKELERELTGIDRALPGLRDLATAARQGITPGTPALSVLYHVLASPAVHPLTGGKPGPKDYPTLEELDTIENYIFARKPRKLSEFSNPVIAVFACQYRTRDHAPHQKHADLAFARAGVARVGTEASRYASRRRSFDPHPANGDRGFAVQPARYVAYIAEYGPVDSVILRPVPEVDDLLTFVIPAHKLFAGRECLLAEDDSPLNIPSLKFAELHINEKLARMHRNGEDNPGRIPSLPGFDLEEAPFVRSSLNDGLVRLEKIGDSVLIAPIPKPLVRLASQKIKGKHEPARFKVPRETDENRFWTSLGITSTDKGRAAPEYANIRLNLTKKAGQWRKRDLNDLPDPSFDETLRKGGYEAAHLIDGTCDGVVALAPIPKLSIPVLPAYSLVTAIDYFPQVDQASVVKWLELRQGVPVGLGKSGQIFPQGGPDPLSDGRFHVKNNPAVLKPTRAMPNSQLANPLTKQPAFPVEEAANLTATAIVGFADRGVSLGDSDDSGAASWLPDAASGVFAPGWDVSQHVINDRPNYVAYGLGSPFPEDSKLCAALNSFWPAVAPDSSRTYGFGPGGHDVLPTSIPLMDSELGYHPQHPRVLAGEVKASIGWDGDQGPFLAGSANARFINAMNPARADQSLAALAGRLGFSGLDEVDSDAFLRRIEALIFCKTKLLHDSGLSNRNTWLVGAEAVSEWATWKSKVWPRANPALEGPGFIFVFARANPSSRADVGSPPLRLRYTVIRTAEIHLAYDMAFRRIDAQPFQRFLR